MNEGRTRRRTSHFEWLLYIYVFLMPFTNFHPLRLNSIFGALSTSPAFFVSVVGMVLLLINTHGKIILDSNGLFRHFTQVVIALNFISIVMALVLYKKLGVLGNETTLNAILGDFIYWLQVLFIILFNIMLFQKVTFASLEKIVEILIIVTLAIGYIEIGMLLFGGPFRTICNILYNLGVIYNPQTMLRTEKIFLVYSEASYVEIVLCALVWPYACSQVLLTGNDNKSIIKYLLCFGLTIPIVIFNQSSSVMLGLAVTVVLVLFFFFKRRKITRSHLIFFIFVLVVAIAIIYAARDYFVPLFVEKVLEKPFDSNDYSTIQRSSVIRNCILTFLEYPILGVGNGNQGYFYEQHLTANDYRSYEVLETLKYTNGVPSAGSWFGGVLSGYGIVGVIIIGTYVLKSNRIMKCYKDCEWYYVYYLTAGCFLICSWFTASLVGGYLQILFLSLPFVISRHAQQTTE